MVAAAACLWHPSGANFDEIGAVYIAHYAVEIGEHRTRQRGISGATTGLVHYIQPKVSLSFTICCSSPRAMLAI